MFFNKIGGHPLKQKKEVKLRNQLHKKRKNQEKSRKSRHHIIPQSRVRDNRLENIVIIDIKKHNDYHRIFENKTPQEIVIYLTDYFWKGNINFAIEAINEYQNAL